MITNKQKPGKQRLKTPDNKAYSELIIYLSDKPNNAYGLSKELNGKTINTISKQLKTLHKEGYINKNKEVTNGYELNTSKLITEFLIYLKQKINPEQINKEQFEILKINLIESEVFRTYFMDGLKIHKGELVLRGLPYKTLNRFFLYLKVAIALEYLSSFKKDFFNKNKELEKSFLTLCVSS